MPNDVRSKVVTAASRSLVTMDNLVIVLLLLQGVLWTYSRSNWFGIEKQNGWPVLAAAATVFVVVLLVLLWFAVSARFRARFRYSTRSLLLLVATTAIACGWLGFELQVAKREAAAIRTALDAGGSVRFRTRNSPEGLRRQFGDEFFSDVETVTAKTEPDFFGPDPDTVQNTSEPTAAFDENTLLAITKGLTDVKTLDLTKAKIGDAALVHLAKFGHVDNLYLSETQITDAGLIHLKRIPSLRRLWLSNTRIEGEGLVHLSALPKLESIGLEGTVITDESLRPIGALANLTSVGLEETQITDAGLQHLSGLVQLQSLNLTHTKIGDAGLRHLEGLTKLRWLTLRNTNVGDGGAHVFEGMTELEHLWLDDTQIGDGGLKYLTGLKKLKILTLDDTQVTDAGVTHLEKMTSLDVLIVLPGRIGEPALKRLRDALPRCRIND